MLEEAKKDAETRMRKSLDALRHEFSKIRTGRAHTSLLDHVTVEYYGTDVPLTQAANVTVEDARTLSITPYEKAMVGEIEKAIIASDLGLNPSTAGEVIRIILPALTEDRRRELVKVVKAESENARIAIRNIRRDVNNDLKEMLSEKMISEDDLHKGEQEIQKITDHFIDKVENMLEDKEKEMMAI